MKPDRISMTALERLTRTSQVKLLSDFKNVMNIDTDYGIVSIQKPQVPRTPFALIIGEDFRFNELHEILSSPAPLKSVPVPDRIRKIMAGAEPYSSFMVQPLEKPDISLYLGIIHEIDAILKRSVDSQGLDDLSRHIRIDNNVITADLSSDSSDLHSFITQRLNQVFMDDIPGALISMVGLGSGLTPSMDDFIVGLLAVLTFFDKDCSLHFHSQIRTLLSRNLNATNPISGAFLEGALQQMFAEPVLNLFSAFETGEMTGISSALDNLLKIGHSSGLDSLNGILFGMKILRSLQASDASFLHQSRSL